MSILGYLSRSSSKRPRQVRHPQRALGAGTATSWLRIAQIVSPLVIGVLLGHIGVAAVCLLLAGMGIVGGITVWLTAVETKGRRLEEISL